MATILAKLPWRAGQTVTWCRGEKTVQGRLTAWFGPRPQGGYSLSVIITRVDGEPVHAERPGRVISPGPAALPTQNRELPL